MGFSFKSGTNSSASSSGRSVGAAIFFSIFLLFGVVFIWVIGAEITRIIDSYSWDASRCLITQSSVEDRGGEAPYHFVVRYTYSYRGRGYVGDNYQLSDSGSGEYRDAQQLVDKYRVGSSAECFVNPKDPSEVILEYSSLWFGLFLLIPLVFVLIGAGGVYASLKGSAVSDSTSGTTSISDKASDSWTGAWIGVIFFGIFFLAGAGMAIPLLVTPFQKYFDSQGWLVLDCKVESSRVRSHDSDDGTTYSVDILYSYEVDGRTYKSNTFDFIGGSSSGYASKKKIVRRHPPGKVVSCYVNPNDPADAVLDREIGYAFLLGLLPLIFMAVGGGGLYMILRSGGGPKPLSSTYGSASIEPGLQGADWLPAQPAAVYSAGTPMPVLKPSASPVARLIGMFLAAAFITGIVSVFANEVWSGWAAGNPDWFLTIFIMPFLLMVFASWFGIVYFFLALWNPRPEVSLRTLSPRLGESVSLTWNLRGQTSSISKFDIFVEGVEEAQYRRGTTTYTDKHTFMRIPVVQNLSGMHASSGEGSFTLPKDSMHSFSASNNKIVWTLIVKGEIVRWPDIKEAFSIRVLPASKDARSGGLW